MFSSGREEMRRGREDLCSGCLGQGGEDTFSCHSLAQGQECRFLLPKSLWSHDLTLDDRGKTNEAQNQVMRAEERVPLLLSPRPRQHRDPPAAEAFPAQAAPSAPQLCYKVLPSIGLGCRPGFPSGMQLEGGKQQILTLHISARAEWSFSGAKPRRVSTCASPGLLLTKNHPSPRAALRRLKTEGRCVRGPVAKPGKNISSHTLLWYVPAKSKKTQKPLDIHVLESFKSLS